MENATEQTKEMTAEESLSLITETLNSNRKEIIQRSSKYYILWGTLLTIFSIVIYLLWKLTDKEAWNNLWFAMPVIGFLLARLMSRRDADVNVQNDVSRITQGIWIAFGIFASVVAAFTVLYSKWGVPNIFRVFAVVNGMTAEIILLFGLAECISGIALKNWIIKIAGFVTGFGGMVIYYNFIGGSELMFIFTFAGLVLMVTGLIVKRQYR